MIVAHSSFHHGEPSMLNRRQFLTHTLKGSSLVALNAMVPQFVARTAQAAAPGKDNILVVLEMTGGNDGLNTVIPYADDLYHKARPTLRQTKDVGHPPGRPRRPELRHAGLPADVGEGTVWPSCRASAIPTPSARTSRRWISGSRPIPNGRSRPAGWAGPPPRSTTIPAASPSCTSARTDCRSPWPGRPGAVRSR